MSIDAINWVFGNRRHEPGLRGPKAAPRLVLLVLANYANDDGECFPGIDTVAAEANVTRDTAKDALNTLIAGGYIERLVKTGPPRKGSRQPRNVYRLLWDVERAKSTPSLSDAEGVEIPTERGRNAPDRGGEMPAAPAATPSSLNPSEPKVEPGASPGEASLPLEGLNAPAVELTAGQRAKRMQIKFWKWCEGDEGGGHSPRSVNPLAFQLLMQHFIEHGVMERPLGDAVKTLYLAGRPVIRATIDAELDGRRPRNGRPSTHEKLATAEFDADGNLVR